MPIKSLLYRFQPATLYIILVLSIFYFSVQLVLSHITHALTLLFSSYHMLCNIFALAGCIITIKQSNHKSDTQKSTQDINGKITYAESSCNNSGNSIDNTNKIVVVSFDNCSKNTSAEKNISSKVLSKCKHRELKLRNTFGWARIDILAMLIVCIILASLSFSLLVEALQTLVHIDHQDTMHLPIPVMILGFVGLLLNGLTYLLIGGYTLHQGSFLHVTESGSVILDRTMSNSLDLALQLEERQLSSMKLAREQRAQDVQLKQQLQAEGIETVANKKSGKCGIRRQGAAEMLRDISSTLFVIVCGFIVFMAEDEQHTAKFIDPVLSIFSCVLLVSLSYRYMKESCLILLQTIPDSIDMENFESTLVKRFPQIVSYHDLHIWQLAAHKYIATVHIQFENPKLYALTIDEVRAYFHDNGIAELTIQPEFYNDKASSVSSASVSPSMECLMQCSAPECAEKVCCKDSRTDLREIVSSCPAGKTTNTTTLISSIQMPISSSAKETSTHLKLNLLKKLIPRLNIAKGIERSKSTNDLNLSNVTQSQQQVQQHHSPKTVIQTNLKKTFSESNMNMQENNITKSQIVANSKEVEPKTE